MMVNQRPRETSSLRWRNLANAPNDVVARQMICYCCWQRARRRRRAKINVMVEQLKQRPCDWDLSWLDFWRERAAAAVNAKYLNSDSLHVWPAKLKNNSKWCKIYIPWRSKESGQEWTEGRKVKVKVEKEEFCWSRSIIVILIMDMSLPSSFDEEEGRALVVRLDFRPRRVGWDATWEVIRWANEDWSVWRESRLASFRSLPSLTRNTCQLMGWLVYAGVSRSQ